jgi:hypothetical protein
MSTRILVALAAALIVGSVAPVAWIVRRAAGREPTPKSLAFPARLGGVGPVYAWRQRPDGSWVVGPNH